MTLKHKLLTTIAALLMTAAGAKAQKLIATLSHYSTDDGLASNAISKLMQDDYGYIWIATWNGVSRFDGYHFYNYQTGNGSHIPNLHNRIYDFVADQQQNIWLRMYDGRIFVIDRHRDIIVNPFKEVSGSDEYRSDFPLMATSSGSIIASIKDIGLYIMRMEDGKFNCQLITTAQLTPSCLAEGYHNDIWVGTDKGVHRMDMGNFSLERTGMFEEEAITTLYSNGYNLWAGTKSGKILLFAYGQEPKTLRQHGDSGLLHIFVDSFGIIWFSDARYGVTRLNPATGDEKHFEQRVLNPEYDGFGGEFREVAGVVWVLMNHGGYGYYNRETDEVEYFHNDPVNPWNLSNTVNANLELPEGVIFESTTRRALEKLEILKNNISRTLLVPNAESSIDNEIRGMLYNRQQKQLLLGNKHNALFIIREDGSRSVINQDSEGNPIGRTYGLAQGANGVVWLSSKDNGLFKLTPSGGNYHIQNIRHDDNDQWSMSSNAAYQAVEDKHGNVWVATYGGGVNVLTRDKEGKQVFMHSKNVIKKYPHNSYMKVRTITIDKEGTVWAGTTDGILLMTMNNGTVSIKKLQNSDEYPDQILMSNDIVYLACDKHGDMWVGTNSGGLSHVVGRDSKGNPLFENFGSKDGLPSEEIKSITFDHSGNVWFATDHSICSFNTAKRSFTSFGMLDGVDETRCSEGAAITLPNGNILFGTLNGYYTVDRKKLVTNNGSMLKLRITDFFLNDELMTPRYNSTFDFYVPDAKSVTMPEHNDIFAFRFAALNYQLQHRIHYQFMLQGYDHEWRNADKTRTVTYVGVPSGTYKFRVKAFLLESPDNFDMKTIEVTVPPYFLLSSSAVWIYMILIMAIALFLMFWRQNRLRLMYKESQGLQSSKDSQESMNTKDSQATAAPQSQQESTTPTEDFTDAYEIIDD